MYTIQHVISVILCVVKLFYNDVTLYYYIIYGI